MNRQLNNRKLVVNTGGSNLGLCAHKHVILESSSHAQVIQISFCQITVKGNLPIGSVHLCTLQSVHATDKEHLTRVCSHCPFLSPFFLRFKNEFNVFLWCRLVL